MDKYISEIKNEKETGTLITFDMNTMEILEAVFLINKDGVGFEHELTELEILVLTLKLCPEVVNYPWKFSSNIFHTMTVESLES